MTKRLDDQGREWTGNFHRQRLLTQRIERLCNGQQVIDIMASIGTVAANIIADASEDEATALSGLDAHLGDLRAVVHQRFAAKKASH